MPNTGANHDNLDSVLSQWASIPPPPDCVYKEGACVGRPQEGFFLDGPSQRDPRLQAALACCKVCPVRQPCLEYALGLPWATDFGIWGGTNRNQRRKMRNGNG